jgi:hypothetical protein
MIRGVIDMYLYSILVAWMQTCRWRWILHWR